MAFDLTTTLARTERLQDPTLQAIWLNAERNALVEHCQDTHQTLMAANAAVSRAVDKLHRAVKAQQVAARRAEAAKAKLEIWDSMENYNG